MQNLLQPENWTVYHWCAIVALLYLNMGLWACLLWKVELDLKGLSPGRICRRRTHKLLLIFGPLSFCIAVWSIIKALPKK